MTDNNFTIPSAAEANMVNVATFRDQTENLDRCCRVDFPACVNHSERTRWAEVTRKVASDLMAMTCKRAKHEDWVRRERAIDQSASMVGKVLFGIG